MNHSDETTSPVITSRRDFLNRCGMGMGSLGLAALLGESSRVLADEAQNPLAPRPPHFPAKAKHVIHFFLNGGLSHVDSFDHKPALTKFAGKPLPFSNPTTERKTGSALPSPYKFKKYGQSGIEVSDIFPHVGSCADDIAVIKSMVAEVPNHEPSLMLMNCGDPVMSRPSMGSWVTYGLGSENQNLPGFISMCPGGYPIKESENWQSGFLPGIFQGTFIDPNNKTLDKLIENIRSKTTTLGAQRQQLDLLKQLNAEHQKKKREHDAQLEARIQSFELAYRMQMEAAEAFDVDKEPEHIKKMYGDGVHARQTLIARRLIERGVRFVQLWHGAGQPWDNHDDITVHATLAKQCDQALGALIKDLKQRGLFDETLIVCGGEFGRTPVVELTGKKNGRDHNPYGFSVWLAGGGIKGGTTYGATDEFGFRAVEKVTTVHDLHATILHLLGFDHERFTYRYSGRDFRLTDVYGKVVKDIVA